MGLNISHGIDLQALSALNDNHYLSAQQRGSTQIQTSAQPIKGSFLFFSVGTSDKHRYGFDQLKAQVRRQFGFELQADHAGTGKITVGSLKRQIADAQRRNGDVYNALLKNVHRTYGERHDDAFAADQMRFAFEQVRDDFGAGHVLTAARKEQLDNQLEIRSFAHLLERRFDAGAKNAFLVAVNAKLNNGEKLSDTERAQWCARFSAGNAVGELGARIEGKLGAPAKQAAINALAARITGLTTANVKPPVALTRYGQIPQAWADEALDVALQTHVANLAGGLTTDQREQAVALAQGRTATLKAQQARLGGLERGLAGTARDASLSAHPAALFRPGAHPGGDVYQLCEDLAGIQKDSTLARLDSWRGDAANVAPRLTEAQHIARLGLQLRQSNVPPQEAAYILHMEATLRAMGAGDPQADQFAPLLAGLQDARDLAQQAIALETAGHPNLSKATVGQLLELELAERVANRGASDFQHLSPHTDELVQDRAALAALQRHGVPLPVYGDYRQRGAQTADEVIHTYRLGVVPEALHQVPTDTTRQVMQQWQTAGFSEAETQAYMLHFDSPDQIRGFQGSLLKPDEINAYRESGIPLTEHTRLGPYRDSNQVGEPKRLGNGAYNVVHLTRYRGPDDPNGYAERVFKSEPTGYASGDPGNLGKNSLRNCLASFWDQKIRFNVLARTEVGMVGGRLGISMSRAKGAEAYAQQVGQKHEEVVTPQSKYSALLLFRDRVEGDSELRKNLCQRYRLTGIRVNAQNQLVVMPALVAQHKEDPQLQKELTKLQLMDALIGNRDRHLNNYFVDFDPETEQVTVTGVDNDDAFNSDITKPSQFSSHNTRVGLPPVVDREMLDAITGIDETEYRNSLGRLSNREANAAVSRLRNIKSHLQTLERTGRVIEPGDPVGWGSPQVTSLLTSKNSYVGRDCVVFPGVPQVLADRLGF